MALTFCPVLLQRRGIFSFDDHRPVRRIEDARYQALPERMYLRSGHADLGGSTPKPPRYFRPDEDKEQCVFHCSPNTPAGGTPPAPTAPCLERRVAFPLAPRRRPEVNDERTCAPQGARRRFDIGYRGNSKRPC